MLRDLRASDTPGVAVLPCANLGQHLNFFCRRSLAEVIRKNEMKICYIGTELATYGAMTTPVIKLIAQKGTGDWQLPGYHLNLFRDFYLVMKKKVIDKIRRWK